MNIAVCVKLIPDPSVPGKLDPTTYDLARLGKVVLDDSDSYGVEIALQLASISSESTVTLVSMGPDGDVSGLRTALAMGADNAILVSDPRLVGSDALSTAKVLAAAIKKNPFDLVVAGTESTDGYTGTTPVQVAEILGIPSVTFAKKVEVSGTELNVQRQTELGYDDVVCPLPALITVTAGVVEPRYPSFKGIMSAKSKPVVVMNLNELGLDPSSVGRANAREEVVSVRPAESRASGSIVVDDGNGYLEVIRYLEKIKVI